MGGLFTPEAFITATRQAAAQANQGWSVENLELCVHLDKSTIFSNNNNKASDQTQGPAVDDASFVVVGLTLEGATIDPKSRALQFCNESSVSLGSIRFSWKLKGTDKEELAKNQVHLPIYLNDLRTEFLSAVGFDSPDDLSPQLWYQRGVGLTVWREKI